jgi:hypothetical protein
MIDLGSGTAGTLTRARQGRRQTRRREWMRVLGRGGAVTAEPPGTGGAHGAVSGATKQLREGA